jgi:hypothetical protein
LKRAKAGARAFKLSDLARQEQCRQLQVADGATLFSAVVRAFGQSPARLSHKTGQPGIGPVLLDQPSKVDAAMSFAAISFDLQEFELAL